MHVKTHKAGKRGSYITHVYYPQIEARRYAGTGNEECRMHRFVVRIYK